MSAQTLEERAATLICMAGMSPEVATGWEPEQCVQREEHLQTARAVLALIRKEQENDPVLIATGGVCAWWAAQERERNA